MKHMTYEKMIQDVADLHARLFRKHDHVEQSSVSFSDLFDIQKELLVAALIEKDHETFYSDWAIQNSTYFFKQFIDKIKNCLHAKDDYDKKERLHRKIGEIIEGSVIDHFREKIEEDINRQIDLINSKYSKFHSHSQQMEFETGVRAVGEI